MIVTGCVSILLLVVVGSDAAFTAIGRTAATTSAAVKSKVGYYHCYDSPAARRTTDVFMVNKKTGKHKSGAAASKKGFGSVSTTNVRTVEMDRSPPTEAFYSYLEAHDAGANLQRVALAYFPNNNQQTIRGVVALKAIPKGQVIIEIPYEAAWNLGQESLDPTIPATIVLQEYCRYSCGIPEHDSNPDDSNRGPYLAMMPTLRSSDCRGSTDFFPQEALESLQSPPVVQETLRRREKTLARFVQTVEPLMIQISDNDCLHPPASQRRQQLLQLVTEEHLRWAVWLVTSRVLTVQETVGTYHRMLIPLIDMCNHDRNSPHILTGRAMPGSTLKVITGKNVEAGEQVTICYGGGVAGNDRFIQDYGFLDMDPPAFDIVAKILTGRRRIPLHGSRPILMPLDQRNLALEALNASTIEEDERLLSSQWDTKRNGSLETKDDVISAIEYRIGVKKALAMLDDVV